MQACSVKMLKNFYDFRNRDSIAVVDEDGKRKTSYKDFVKLTNSIAAHLKENGVVAGDVVAIELDRCMEHYASRIACHFIGAIFLSVNPHSPQARKDTMYAECKPKYIIKEAIEAKDCPCQIDESLSDSDYGYMIYTSGTTGKPKGILHDRSIFNLYETLIYEFYPEEYHVEHAAISDMTFVMSLIDTTFLYTGDTVHAINDKTLKDVFGLKKYFTVHKINWTFILPQLLYVISPIESLKVAFIAGEKCNLDFSQFKTDIYNFYGASEAPGISYGNAKVNNKVGGVLHNTKLSLSSEGEVIFSGPGVMVKYIDGEPLESKDGMRIYHTNDKGIQSDDGSIQLIGRIDSTVKVRGMRVDTAEVEYHLARIKGIGEVVVKAFDNNGETYLCAYYSSLTGKPLPEEYIKGNLAKNLNPYMIPAQYVFIPMFKRNEHGKVDRNSLEEPSVFTSSDTGDKHLDFMIDTFKKILNANEVDKDSNFITLGGNSLSAMKMQLAIKEKFKIDFPASRIIELSTPGKISQTIKGFKNINYDNKYTLLTGAPLSEQQLNIYLDIVMNKKVESYLIPLIMKLDKYSVPDMVKSLENIMDIHPILKCYIDSKSEIPFIRIGNKPTIKIVDTINKKELNSFLNSSFDINQELARFLIVKEKKKLYAVFHHLIFDGLSVSVFSNHLIDVLEHKKISEDTNFLKASCFSEKIKKTKLYREAEVFYEKQFVDNENIFDLIPDINENKPSYRLLKLNIDQNRINEFIKKHNITKNVLFTSVFAYTLSRFTNADKSYFVMIENGRDLFTATDSIGMFVNTLPIIIECRNDTVSNFIKNSKEKIYQTINYNFYPFRSLSNKYNVNANIEFQYRPDISKNFELSGNGFLYEEDLKNRQDLISDLSFVATDDSIDVTSSKKYSSILTEKILHIYERILQEILIKDNLKEINYTIEKDVITLNKINNTETKLQHHDILEAFNNSLQKYPNNVLISYLDTKYTYGEGTKWINNLTKEMKNVPKGSNVAICVHRSHYCFLTALSVLNHGSTYVPIDDSYPDERIKFMIKDSNAKVILVTNETIDRVKKLSNISIVNVSEIKSTGTLKPLCINAGIDECACVLYTSGTTGTPKGSIVTRRAIINLAEWYVKETKLGIKDVYSMYVSYVFDMHTLGFYTPLIVGASLDIVPQDVRLDLYKLNEHFNKVKATHTYMTAQVGKLYAEGNYATTIKLLCFGGMKLGELHAPDSIGPFESYGPTENLAISTSIFANKRMHHSSIGNFVNNVKGYILDKEYRRVPVGATGELYLSGYQLAKGYLNRDKENKEAFIVNPFDGDKQGYERMYKTGDIVRLLPDKTLGIVGRVDSQVKIRGNRVELGEVETCIKCIKEVKDSTVQMIQINGNNELVAYVEADNKNIKDNVIEYVRNNKPSYMVPSHVVVLDKIPLNINGKVDKRALPKPHYESLIGDYEAPATEEEKIICNIFAEVLQQEKIGINDDFMKLGGDSIKAIRVVSLLRSADLNVLAKTVLEEKTPAKIAKLIEKKKVTYNHTSGEVELLPIQSYFFDEINRNNCVQIFVLKSKVKLDKDKVQKAINDLVVVHDMLRAKYSGRQTIQDKVEVKVEYSNDLSASMKLGIKSLDIKSGKLMYVAMNEDCICFAIHHLVVDGVSWSILINDFTELYNDKKVEVPYPYAKWVDEIHKYSKTIGNDKLEYYKRLKCKKLSGRSVEFSDSIKFDYNADNIYKISEQEIFLTALSRAYKKIYNKDIILNMESHGRDDSIADVNHTVGWFTSQYPIQIISGNSPISDVFSTRSAVSSVEHLGIDYGCLVYIEKKLRPINAPVTFNYLSDEFSFENSMFTSVDFDRGQFIKNKHITNSITFDIHKTSNEYCITGSYPEGIKNFNEFLTAFKEEIICVSSIDDNIIVSPLSESQLGVFLDEQAFVKNTAYSCNDLIEWDGSIEEAHEAIDKLITNHPILRSRIDNNMFLISDAKPEIKHVSFDTNENILNKLIKAFNFNSSLSRFWIVDVGDKRYIAYDIHHMISDATSGVLIREELFNPSNKIDIEYLNFALDEKINEDHLDYFEQMFFDIDNIPTFLYDVLGHAGSVSLPLRGVREKLLGYCKQNNTTPGSILNMVFGYTLSRFVGYNKVFYNFTYHGRKTKELENALGMYVKTIPVVLDCSCENFVAKSTELILTSMDYSDYPYRLLSSKYGLNSDIIFEYNTNLNDLSLVEGDELIESDYYTNVDEFGCIVNDLNDGYLITISHSSNYSQETAKNFVYAYKSILLGLLDGADIREIQYSDDKPIEFIKKEYKYSDVMQGFADNLAKYPDNKLVGDYTFKSAASMIMAMQFEPDDRVAVFIHRSEWYLLCSYAVLASGATYIPIDDEYPDERIEYMLADTGANKIIVSNKTKSRVEKYDINVDELKPVDTEFKYKTSELACILYTSGTTGKPKGSLITRKALNNYVNWFVNYCNVNSSDRMCMYRSYGFDSGNTGMFVSCIAGSSTYIVPSEARLDIDRFNDYVTENKLTVSGGIPVSFLKIYLKKYNLSTFKAVITGGEAFGEIDDNIPDCLYDGYGPTESLDAVCSIRMKDKIHPSSVGKFLDNVYGYVLDAEKRSVPQGAVGELYITGDQLAQGYLNFDDGSFDDGMYKTGDMVRILPDKTIGFIGRRDKQYKIRGNRVELGEVETCIREVVDDVTVDVVNKEIVAYVVGDSSNVKSHVAANKPSFMVPTFVIEIDKIPLNVNGKVDKRALPKPDFSSLMVKYVAPRNDIEQVLCSAFNEILEVNKVGIDDDFMRLGGDSIKAVRVVSYLNEKGYEITARDVLNKRSIRLLSDSVLEGYKETQAQVVKYDGKDFYLENNVYCLSKSEYYALAMFRKNSKRSIIEDIYKVKELLLTHKFEETSGDLTDQFKEINEFLTDTHYQCGIFDPQLNFYLDEITNNKNRAYFMPGFIEVDKSVSDSTIEAAVRSVIKVHPLLSSRAFDGQTIPLYICDVDVDVVKLKCKDLSQAYMENYKSFDIHDHLSEFYIIETDDKKYIGYSLHHIISDGISHELLNKELAEAIAGKFNRDLDLEFITTANESFCQQFSHKYKEAHKYFTGKLVDIESDITDIFGDMPGNAGEMQVPFAGMKSEINDFAESMGISVPSLFDSIFGYAISRFSGSDTVCFNITEHGRNLRTKDALGMYVRSIPLTLDCSNTNVKEFLTRSNKDILNTLQNGIYPLRKLISEFKINNNIALECNFGVLKSIDKKVSDITYAELDSSEKFVSELEAIIYETQDGYLLNISHTDRYSKDLIIRFGRAILDIAKAVMAVENLDEIQLLNRADSYIQDMANNKIQKFNVVDIVDAFQSSTKKYPNNKCLSHLDLSYTYAEVDMMTNYIASKMHYKQQDVVAILTHRSHWYILLILACLKADITYIPIDATLPSDRIKLMISQADTKCVFYSNQTEDLKNASIEGLKVDTVCVDDIKFKKVKYTCAKPTDDSLNCIIYTSGTTNLPKGVCNKRITESNLSQTLAQQFNFTQDDVYGLYASIGYSPHLDSFLAYTCGASIDVVPEDIRLEMDALNEYFESHHITSTFISSSVMYQFFTTQNNKSLRVAFRGGEKVKDFDYDGDCIIQDEFGCTECSNIFQATNSQKMLTNELGYSIGNTDVYILDDNLNRLPVLAIGELYVTGNQVSSRYLRLEEETNERYLDNPFGPGKMFKTGDYACFLPNGSVYNIGRRDSLIKIRGNRVDISEVETALRSLEYIDDAVVVDIDNNGNAELVAYIVSNAKYDDIEEHLSKKLASYMIPTFIEEIDEIPLNVNGKVDKRVLPQPNFQNVANAYVAPTNEIEKKIITVFEQVLNQSRVGIEDDFIRLGGDSLSAIRASQLLTEHNITASDILNLRKPKQIAKSYNQTVFDISEFKDKFPLTEPQLNIYLDVESNKNTQPYLIYSTTQIDDKYSQKDILKALDQVINAHKILRTKIVVDDKGVNLAYKSSDNIKFSDDIDTDLDIYTDLSKFYIYKKDGHNHITYLIHHIIFDGFASINFEKDLKLALEGKTLIEDTCYLQASAYSRDVKHLPIYKKAAKYFDKSLSLVEDMSDLLLDPNGSSDFIKFDFDISEDEIKNIDSNVTSVLYSAFSYALSKFTGSEEVYFNFLDNGRSNFNNSLNAIGMYVNTLPLVVDCKDAKIDEFIHRVSDSLKETLKYNFYSYRELTRKYGLVNDILIQYDLDIDVNFENADTKPVAVSNLDIYLCKTKKNIRGYFVFSDKYSAAKITRLAHTMNKVLNGFLYVNKLSDIQLTLKEDQKIFDDINNTPQSLKYKDILEAFNFSLKKYPDNVLVSYYDTKYTYSEGAKWINNLTKKLKNIPHGSNIAIFVQRSHFYLLSALSVLNHGCAYVPIDDGYPDERVEFMLKDSSSKAVLVTDETIKRVKNFTDIEIINVSEVNCNGNLLPLNVDFSEKDTAIILYTSGTTGVPKGTLITRLAINNVALWYTKYTNMNSSDIYSMYTVCTFDMHVIAYYPHLIVGASLDIVPNNIRLDLHKLNDHFNKVKATHTMITTNVGKMFVSLNLKSTIKFLLVIGEKLGEFKAPDSIGMCESYGPTESLALISAIPVNSRLYSNSIGHLISNIKIYILDKEHRRVPVGAVGELYISGYQLAKGYLNRDKENKKSFLTNFYDGDKPGYERMYKTGDIVRLLPDNTLGFVGRADSQVKIRGNRVELGEVETCIRSIKEVIDTTVQAIQVNGNNELVAYVASTNNDIKDSVVQYVTEHKPAYMVPSHVVVLEKIPLNVNGKVDKRALPKPDISSLKVEYVAPSNNIEKSIVESFEQILEVTHVGVDDDFVRLGGDSIKSIRLVAALNNLGYKINASTVFQNKTPRAIAANIEVPVSQNIVFGELEFSPTQKLYLSSKGQPSIRSITLKCDINEEKLYESIGKLIEVQDALRLDMTDKQYIKQVMPRVRYIAFEYNKGLLTIYFARFFYDRASIRILLDALTRAYNDEELFPVNTYRYWIENDNTSCSNDLEPVGSGKQISATFDAKFNKDNTYGLLEEEYLLIAISRAFSVVYEKDPKIGCILDGRNLTTTDYSKTLGNFEVNKVLNIHNDSILRDIYSIKKICVDTARDDKCDFRFNFNDGAVYKNDLFEETDFNDPIELKGYVVNVSRKDGKYTFGINYKNSSKEFAKAIGYELENVTSYLAHNNHECAILDPQLNFYLDEIANTKNLAYYLYNYIETDKTDDEITSALIKVFDKYPILSSRVSNDAPMPMFVCDVEQKVERIETDDLSKLFRESFEKFNINKNLTKFWIVQLPERKLIAYSLHHIISDAKSNMILANEIKAALDNKLESGCDLGFMYASNLAYYDQFKQSYKEAYKFFEKRLALVDSESIDMINVIPGNVGNMKVPMYGMKDKIGAYAKTKGVSVASLFNSIFAYVLSRFSGSNIVTFNITEHGRDAVTNNSIGMFVRSVPLVLDCNCDNIDDYLHESHAVILETLQNSIYPIRKLIREFDVSNNIALECNFGVMEQMKTNQREISYEKLSDDTKFVSELEAIIFETSNGYLLNINHTNRYSEELIKRFGSSFLNIVNNIFDSINMSDIQLLNDEDLTIQENANNTVKGVPDTDIVEQFKKSVKKYPDNVALRFKDAEYTYSELDKMTDYIAASMPYKQQDVVAILTERSHWYMILILACLKADITYIPIDSILPPERIKLMINQTDTKCVFYSGKTKELMEKAVDDLELDRVCVDDIEFKEVEYTCAKPTDKSLNCIIYTSGTTNLPKGVCNKRITETNLSNSLATQFNFTEKDVYGLYASIGYSPHLDSFCAYTCGACIDVVPEEIRLDMPKLNDYFNSHNISSTFFSSSIMHHFFTTVDNKSLRVAFRGGEKAKDFEYNGQSLIQDEFGCTECSNIFQMNNDDKHLINELGYPIANTKVYVLDDHYNRLPVLGIGELYVTGPQVSSHYLNLEKETNERYLDNPFGPGKMFRTGDYCCYLPNGSIYNLGRRDSLLKIRGNRVDVNEVETAFRALDYVDDAIVIDIDNNGSVELVAYMVVNGKYDDIEADLSKKLAPYMIPAFIEEIDEIPLNVNGKVDKKALPEPDLSNLKATYVAPTNDTEKQIVTAFEKILNITKVGIDDDFIKLGGDSLSAMRIVAALPNVRLTAANILNLCTPKAIAKLIEKENHQDLDIDKYRDKCPLNEPQLNVYLDIKAKSNDTSYLVPYIISIDAGYKKFDIEATINKILDIHPILSKKIDNDLCLVDAGKPDIFYKEDLSEQRLNEFMTMPFEMDKNLSRFFIFTRHRRLYLACVFHHIIFDGMSTLVFRDHFDRVLKGEELSQDETYLLSSAYSANVVDLPEYGEAEKFFEEQLGDLDDVADLTKDCDGVSGAYSFKLDIDKKQLASFVKANSLSNASFFTSAFAYTLSRFAGTEHVMFNIVENGRDRFKNTNDAVGMFVNTLPLAVHCEDTSVVEYLKNAADVLYKTTTYNFYPYRLLARKYDVTSSILFQYDPNVAGDLGSGEGDDVGVAVNDTVSDLNINLLEHDESYEIYLNHSDKFSNTTIANFARVFNDIVSGLVTEAKLGDIKFYDDSDVYADINDNDVELTYNNILSAFKENLASYPDNNLVSFKDKHYSYKQGANIAMAIADKLDEHKLVAVLVERSEWYLLCALGVLTAGSTYVPIDDNYPDERIEFMLKDTGAETVLVTNKTKDRVSGLEKINVEELEVKDTEYKNIEISDIACILYTSGTTGIPKGSITSQLALINFVEWYVRDRKLTSTDVYSMHTAYVFDMHTLGLWSPLVVGGCVDIVPEEIRLDIDKLNEHFSTHNVTHTFMTTQLAKLFAENVEKTNLKVLYAAGEALGECNKVGNYEMYDGYGPCENLGLTTSINIDDRITTNSVGKPNINNKTYVLDKQMRQLPKGAVGELYLAGAQLAKGYLNRENETQAAFKRGMYKTGDLVKILPDNTLGFMGRNDAQVKIRGNRVELGEVEACIREIATDVTVQAVNGELVAYVVSNKADDVISKHVEESKPAYMVPSYVVHLDRIPLNVNGKVDKRALPKPTTEAEEYIAPETEIEKNIASVVEEVLEADKISIKANLFKYGLHSLAVIKIMTKLGYSLNTAFMLQNPTIFEWAEYVEQAPATVSSEVLKYYPATNSMNWIYRIVQMRHQGNKVFIYNMPMCIMFKGIDYETLKNAMYKLLDNHLGMKIHMRLIDGKLMYERRDDWYPEIEHKVLDSEPDAAYFAELVQAFDIIEDDLIRMSVHKYEESTYLFVDMHHLLEDDFGVGVVMSNFVKLMSGEVLTPETSTVFDIALRQDKYAAQADEDIAYFKNIYDNYSYTEFTKKRNIVYDKELSIDIEREIEPASIDNYCKYAHITPPNLVLGCVVNALHKATRQNKIMINSLYDGRRSNTDMTVACCLCHTLPVYHERKRGQSIDELIYDLQRQMSDTQAHHLIYAKEAEIGLDKHDESASIQYNYVDATDKSRRSSDVEVLPVKYKRTKFYRDGISIRLFRYTDKYKLLVRYNEDVYDKSKMESLLERICNEIARL